MGRISQYRFKGAGFDAVFWLSAPSCRLHALQGRRSEGVYGGIDFLPEWRMANQPVKALL